MPENELPPNLVLIDYSVLLHHYYYIQEPRRPKSLLLRLQERGHNIAISTITDFDIYTNNDGEQLMVWMELLQKATMLPFDRFCSDAAYRLHRNQQYLPYHQRKNIGTLHLFIAATAIANEIPLATAEHDIFDGLENLQLIRE
jgi:tRNA(fMet)-specific endonuclease VapC